MDCQEFEELSGAYVLGATTAEERQEAEAHLAQCPICQHKLQELQAAVDLLPLTLPPVEPSPRVRERLFDAILAEAPHASPKPIQRRQPHSWWQHWQARLVTAALLFLLLGITAAMTVWNLSLQQRIAQLSAPSAASLTATIHGTSVATGVSGQIIYFPTWHMTTLIVHGLPPLTGTQVYQGWVIENNQPRSLGLLNVQNGAATLDFPGPIQGNSVVAVSREPGPQASQQKPRGPVVAEGPVSQPTGSNGAEGRCTYSRSMGTSRNDPADKSRGACLTLSATKRFWRPSLMEM